ncbi:MAG TPA: FAD-dependent monooxygenase, partial [Xanthobacteraceae bacterium]
MRRHAEIAGGGIGGLGTAMMLASRGWSVRLHERSPEIREIGAGIYIKNNAIEVLEELGIFARLRPQGLGLERSQVLDRDGRIMQDRELGKGARVYAFLRQSLVEALRDEAARAGVEIVTASSAAAADPAGALLLENGSRLRADLVVAADGVRSRVRDSLALGASHRLLPTAVNRYLVPSREIAPDLITREHWSDRYRIGITPCGA